MQRQERGPDNLAQPMHNERQRGPQMEAPRAQPASAPQAIGQRRRSGMKSAAATVRSEAAVIGAAAIAAAAAGMAAIEPFPRCQPMRARSRPGAASCADAGP